MSATILGGDFTIYYLDEDRQKRITWTGAATGTRTMNELYSALQDLFDESNQMDDGIPMSAQTPTEYTIGKIDAGDNDPWYIDYETMQHLTNGALRTTGWARVQDSNTGLVVVPCTNVSIASSDVGDTCTHSTGDTGTIVDWIDLGGATEYIVIRPTDDTITHSWDTGSGTITADTSTNTATQSGAPVTGEQVWANLYSIGTIEADTHIYVYQGTVSDDSRARVYDITDQTQDWWGDGHIDICVPLKDYTTASFPTIDGGYLTVYARQYSKTYAHFEVANSTTSGGRNPIPLGTGTDLNNTTGYKTFSLSGASGNWNVGDEISGDTSGARAIITAVVDGATATPDIDYYLIDDPLTDFNGSEAITNEDDTGAATGSGATSDAGPALSTWFTNNTPPTLAFNHTTYDTDDDGTAENYGITVHCQSNPLDEVYEYLKYITRRGNTADIDPGGDTIIGESYIGCEAYLAWTGTVTGTIAEGADVTQETSGATGVIVSYYDSGGSGGYVLLRDVRGTFVTHATTATLTDNDNSGTVEIDSVATNFAPVSQAPFGSFAGGRFFGARGVLLSNWVTADENNFQLIDAAGTVKARPQAYSLTITNLVGTGISTATDDRYAVFRLDANGDIEKDEFSAYGGETTGGATLDVDTAIPDDVPGKTAGGVLRLIDVSTNESYRLRYDSWLNNGGAGTDGRFTLSNFAAFTATGGSTTTVEYSTGGFNAAVKRGDLVYDSTQGEVSYVVTVDSDTALTVYPAFTATTSGSTVEINCIPGITVDTADQVYVSLLEGYATASTASASIIVSTDIDYKAVVRNVAASNPNGPLVPFATTGTMTTANESIATIRNLDSIYT